MPKIHFASLFGVDLDYDIMVQWIEHYLGMECDTYTVFLHSMDRTSPRYEFVKRAFETSTFRVHKSDERAYTTQMRNDILERFAQSLNPTDYLVVADSDEFQCLPNWAKNFRDLVMSCDVLKGILVDRWDDTLHEAKPGIPLNEQYPRQGDVFKLLFDKSNDEEKFRWRVPNPRKILAARAGLPVAHMGSHVLYCANEGLKQRSGCLVEHYKWRHNIVERLKTKWYYHEGYAREVASFFNADKVVV